MSDIDLLQSDIDEDLRSSVRALLADRAPAHEVARVYDDPHFDLQAVDDGVFDEMMHFIRNALEPRGGGTER